ncbi:ABC transporter permease subunit [bacterium]|nr:ABC transporter permease subunit [bacterium]
MSGFSAGAAARMGRLTLKELRETLRDRRTILTLVLMPVLVYPLLGITFQKFFITQFAVQEPTEYHVGFESMEQAVEFRNAFSQGNQLLGREIRPGQPLPLKPGEPPDPSLNFIYPQPGDEFHLADAVAEGRLDLGVRIVAPSSSARQQFEFLVRSGSVLGRDARQFVTSRLQAVNDAFVDDYLQSQTPPVRQPFEWQQTSLGDSVASDFSLATLVPLVLILMTVTGAVYPAIDLTAGERERGTLEALIAAPISRRHVLFAKYIAVVAVALLTAMMNLSAMIATAYGTGLEQTLFGSAGLSLTLIVQIFGLLAVFAAFFSAVILAITSIARSFKEAQAYLIPVMLLSLAPGVLALMPGLELTAWLALTPLVNIVVLTRDLLDGHFPLGLASLVLGSSVIYAALALSLAARIFGTDSVLYGSSGTLSDLWQRPDHGRSTPTVIHGMIALGVLFPLFILLGGVPARLTDWSLTQRLLASSGITVLLFTAWPLALAWQTRLDIREGFGLTVAQPRAYLAALLLGVSLWPFAYELEIWTISPERLQALYELFRGFEVELRKIPIAWKLIALAFVPAVCEELFFRGYLFRVLRTTQGRWPTILITATLFGLFHVLVRDALLFERFLPTALMGLVLGWVADRTSSTTPGMLLHVLHNSLVLLLPDWLDQQDPLMSNHAQSHLPSWMIAVATIIAGLGWSAIPSLMPQPENSRERLEAE